MPTYQLLTDRTLAQSSAITPTTLIHIVYTGDPSQNPAGSSYKAELGQLAGIFGGTLNQVLIQGNQTLGEDIILNDMDSIINTGNTIGIQYKTGGTMYQYVTNNVDKTSRLQMDINGFFLDNFNYDDGWYQQIGLDSSGTQLSFSNGYLFSDLSSRTTYQPGSISNRVGDSGSTNYTSVSQQDDRYIITNVSSSTEVNKFSIINDVATYYGTKFNVNNYLSASTIYATTISGGSVYIQTVGSGTPLINLGLDSSGNVVTGTTGGGTFTGGTVNGATNFTNGLSANTISATTYQNLPLPAFFNFGTASTINWNISGSSNNYTATLTAATTLNVSNVRNGEYGTIILTQDSVGSRTITLGTINGTSGSGRHKVSSGGGGSIYLTSNPNAIDIVSFVYDGNILYWTVGNDYT